MQKQLRKEGRRNVYEMQKLQALHQRQTMVKEIRPLVQYFPWCYLYRCRLLQNTCRIRVGNFFKGSLSSSSGVALNWLVVHPGAMQVLQRKTEEAAAATKRLKEILEARKSTKENTSNGIPPSIFPSFWWWIQVLINDYIQEHHICNSWSFRHFFMIVSSSHCSKWNHVGLSSFCTNTI